MVLQPRSVLLTRRQWLAGISTPFWPALAHGLPHQGLQFPRDFGSHPEFALEWWYVTGFLQAKEREFGFQLTFFRSRVPSTQAMTSKFAAKQLVFAHAAVTDTANKRLQQDQRIARVSGGTPVDLAAISTSDTSLQLGIWTLQRRGDIYQAHAKSADFEFKLDLQAGQPPLLQGAQGLSRKGPDIKNSSFYYSLPQMEVTGELSLADQSLPVQGRAWLDHEWSHALLPSNAVGWDWIGMNLLDGSALTAFRLRTQTGLALWAGGSFRAPDALSTEIFEPTDITFTPKRTWKSPRSSAVYPVQWSILVKHRRQNMPPTSTTYTVKAVIDNQELDSQPTTGEVYWEGLSDLMDANGVLVGRGYLEMTGYSKPLSL
jgi:predicted secreted hydrolase